MSLPPTSAPVAAVQATPVLPAERWPLPDLLRGVAILGILCVNMQDFSGYDEWLQSGPDRAAQVFIDLFLNGKFISLFAMLFGAGMLTILSRAGGRRLLRRLLLLLLLGSMHFVLVWHGDIISLYACLGLLLLPPMLLRPPTWVYAAAGSALCAWWMMLRVSDALTAGVGERYSFIRDFPPGAAWSDLAGLRLQEFPGDLYGGGLYNLQWLLGLLLLGMAAQRSGLLARPEQFRPLLRGLALGGFMLGLPISVALAWLNTRSTFAAGEWEVPARMGSGLLLAVGYAGVLGLLVGAGRVRWLQVFAAPGRLALSNYLAQSLVMTSLFSPYGLNLYRHLGAWPCLALALALGALQLWGSALWLKRFRQGPAEGLLRALVYGRGR